MKLTMSIICGDITKLAVDAIVNAANTSLLGGGGVDGAIHRAAGHGLLEECRKLNGCEVGTAKITGGYQLPASWVIHTVGPVWNGGMYGEEELLATCYRSCLELAESKDIHKIAFPAISTGVYHFPPEQAARIAWKTVGNFLSQGSVIQEIIFVCFDDYTFQIYQTLNRSEAG